jgi:hypothetical protein
MGFAGIGILALLSINVYIYCKAPNSFTYAIRNAKKKAFGQLIK